ncbi:cytochrome P450 [Actinosynnema pretiosum subsp. pretiosum]|uniref:Cytochrome P450 n=1 Tax=Actinosynnema pretiosum subsp. pretiosum TaxID=103721 RepID=A0AA45L8G4_9PSEU|nr:putative cytochrome P450 hydroxylase [Actinosynnema pretiosum subsp. pretiosum]QUF05559.1 cytochrome P450 [Actinosynnema pretiosum subsp. pretiosum]
MADQLRYPFTAPDALDPPAEWAELRADRPAAPVTLPSGDTATLVTRYADVRTVLADPRFSRVGATGEGARVGEQESGGVFSSDMSTVLPQSGEGHLRWRRLLNRWFTAKRMAALRPGIEAMADQLLDELVERGAPGDLKAGFAFPLPVRVICTMLGVPDSDRDRFAHWSDTLLSMTRYTQAEIASAQAEFAEYMAFHVAAKRADPGDDLIGELITATAAEGQPMSDAQLVATAQGLLVAGHETTANMIAKMVAMLLADREGWERLVAEPALVRPAVEEALRLDPNPGFGMVRYLDAELAVAGTVLPAGTTVVCSMASANRDDEAFERAGEMDLGRTPNPHLSFGAGAHSCLGQALARTELQAALTALLRRLPGLWLAVPVSGLRRVEGLLVGGLRELPVAW